MIALESALRPAVQRAVVRAEEMLLSRCVGKVFPVLGINVYLEVTLEQDVPSGNDTWVLTACFPSGAQCCRGHMVRMGVRPDAGRFEDVFRSFIDAGSFAIACAWSSMMANMMNSGISHSVLADSLDESLARSVVET